MGERSATALSALADARTALCRARRALLVALDAFKDAVILADHAGADPTQLMRLHDEVETADTTLAGVVEVLAIVGAMEG